MPDAKIDYYWIADQHIHDACGNVHETGCTWERDSEIDAPTLPHEHELIHAYVYARTGKRAIPFLAEGIAEAIGCAPELPVNRVTDVGWPEVVAALPSNSAVYREGALFARSLIRTHGIDAFLRYYAQSPERRDPALFAANFQSFWGVDLDAVWADIHTVPAGVAVEDTKICPCSLPPLALAGAVANDAARAPYWTLPDAGDETLALAADAGRSVSIRDCAGQEPAGVGSKVVLARMPSGAGRFVLAPLVDARLGHFLSDRCDDAVAYQLPPDFFTGARDVRVVIPTPPAESTVTTYLKLGLPSTGQVRSSGPVCPTCGFDQPACQQPPGDLISVPDVFYAQLSFYWAIVPAAFSARDITIERQ